MNRWFVLSLAFTVVAIGLSLALLGPLRDWLPEKVPTHWNIQGEVDGWVPREQIGWILLFLPAVMMALNMLTVALPWLSPEKYRVEGFLDSYHLTMALAGGLVVYLHGVVLYASLDRPTSFDPTRAIGLGILAFFALLGLILPKIGPNFWLGVRTPWTLASPEVWQATHRVARGAFLVAGGGGFLLLCLPLSPVSRFVVLMTAIGVAAFVPVVYSLVYSKRLERQKAA